MEIPSPQYAGLGLANRLTFPCQQNGLSGQLQRRHGTLVRLKFLFHPVPALLAPVRLYVFCSPHRWWNRSLHSWWYHWIVRTKTSVSGDSVELCCTYSDSIQAVQDYPCVSLFLWAVEMFYIDRVLDILPWWLWKHLVYDVGVDQ